MSFFMFLHQLDTFQMTNGGFGLPHARGGKIWTMKEHTNWNWKAFRTLCEKLMSITIKPLYIFVFASWGEHVTLENTLPKYQNYKAD